MNRFAQNTSVPIARTRGEIDRLLRDWGAKAVQWTDEYENDRCTLRFTWVHENVEYLARITVALLDRSEAEKQAWHGGLKKVHNGKLQKILNSRGKSEHRLLLLWIKAALNAVDAGIVKAETIFLPFFEDKDGRTVSEIALPNIAKLRGGSAQLLLSSGK